MLVRHRPPVVEPAVTHLDLRGGQQITDDPIDGGSRIEQVDHDTYGTGLIPGVGHFEERVDRAA